MTKKKLVRWVTLGVTATLLAVYLISESGGSTGASGSVGLARSLKGAFQVGIGAAALGWIAAHLVAAFLSGARPWMADLGEAVRAERQDHVEALLSEGADPNAANESGYTPLIYAADQGNAEMIAVLLERQANPNLGGKGGMTPLLAAVNKDRSAAVRLLLEAGADRSACLEDGRNAVQLAEQRSDPDTVAALGK